MENSFNKLFDKSQRACDFKSGQQTKECEAALFLKSIDVGKRQIRFLASNEDLDRDGEVILPSAFEKRLGIYKSNPVFLASHQHKLGDGSSPVIGRVVNIWIDKVGLWVIVEFAETELASQYWELYSGGFQKAVSVGFISHAAENRPGPDGRIVRTHTDVELLEISAVAVPSNPSALSRSKQKKQTFVATKREQSKEERMLKKIRAEFSNFDEFCEESCDVLLGIKPLEGAKTSLVRRGDIEAVDGESCELNFAGMVTGEEKKFGGFSDLFK